MDDNITDCVRTRSLQIINGDGATIMELACTESGHPEIVLRDHSDGCERICIKVEDNRLSMSFLAKDGSTVLGLGSDHNSGGGITIAKPDNSQIAMISFKEGQGDFVEIVKLHE
ncbi:MAG: hypothetical protein Tsb009_02620 [Planctomycetaceae bacterium]